MPEAQLTTTRSAGTIWVLLTSSLPNPRLPPITNERVADEPVMALPAAESSSTQAPRFFPVDFSWCSAFRQTSPSPAPLAFVNLVYMFVVMSLVVAS